MTCQVCAAGKYAEKEGQTACTNCPAGKYRSETGGEGPYSCNDCTGGITNSSEGSTAITSCVCIRGSGHEVEGNWGCTAHATKMPIMIGSVVGGAVLCVLVATSLW